MTVPSLVGTDFGDIWIYLIFPFVGAALGFLAHKVVTEGDTDLSAGSTSA